MEKEISESVMVRILYTNKAGAIEIVQYDWKKRVSRLGTVDVRFLRSVSIERTASSSQ